ncbi:hypothetical protein JCM3770_001197 [Rhodotorula araucariae]
MGVPPRADTPLQSRSPTPQVASPSAADATAIEEELGTQDASVAQPEATVEGSEVATPIWDRGDSVYRCTACCFEVAFGACEACGKEFERDDGMRFADNELAAANPETPFFKTGEAGVAEFVPGNSHAQLLALGYTNAMIARYEITYYWEKNAVVAVADNEIWAHFAPDGMVELAVEGNLDVSAQTGAAEQPESDTSTEMSMCDIETEEDEALVVNPSWRIHLPGDMRVSVSANDHDGSEFLSDHVDDMINLAEDGPRPSSRLTGVYRLEVATIREGGFVTRRTFAGEVAADDKSGSGQLALVNLEEEVEVRTRGLLFKPFSPMWGVDIDDDDDEDFDGSSMSEEETDDDAWIWDEQHEAVELDEDEREGAASEGEGATEEDVEMA